MTVGAAKSKANYDELKAIAHRFGREADNIEATLTQIERQMAVLQGGDWVGQGADAFFAEMQSSVLPSLRRLKSALRQAQRTTLLIRAEFMQAEKDAAAVLRDSGALPSPFAQTPPLTNMPHGPDAPSDSPTLVSKLPPNEVPGAGVPGLPNGDNRNGPVDGPVTTPPPQVPPIFEPNPNPFPQPIPPGGVIGPNINVPVTPPKTQIVESSSNPEDRRLQQLCRRYGCTEAEEHELGDWIHEEKSGGGGEDGKNLPIERIEEMILEIISKRDGET